MQLWRCPVTWFWGLKGAGNTHTEEATKVGGFPRWFAFDTHTRDETEAAWQHVACSQLSVVFGLRSAEAQKGG